MSKYTYTVDEIQRSPLNSGEFRIGETPFTEGGGYFFRKELSSSVKFGGVDFKYLRSQTDLCREFVFKIRKQLKIVNEVIYTGRFTLVDCAFNDDTGEVVIQMDALDQYTCLIQNWDKEFNLAQVADTAQIWEVETQREIEIGIGVGTVMTPPTILASNGDTDPLNYGLLVEDFENAFLDPLGIPESADFATYCRELVYTACVDGVPQQPDGADWQLENPCSPTSGGYGYSKWWRRLDYTTSFTLDLPLMTNDPNMLAVDIVDPIPDPNTWGFMSFESYGLGTYGLYYNKVHLQALSDSLRNRYVKGGRTFIDAANATLANACGAGYSLSSEFFTNGTNPVTLTPNIASNLQIWTKSDVANAQTTEALAIASLQAADKKITARELLEDIQTHFNTEWYIDVNNPKTVIIEHISDTKPQTVDLDLTTTNGGIQLVRKSAYTSLSSEVPIQERWRFTTANLPDFIGLPIDYTGCGKDVKEYSTSQIDTELDILIGDADQRNLDGFILVQPDSIKSTDSLAQIGIIWAFFAPNMPLSISNLHAKFWPYQRKLPTGKINNVTQTFNSYQKLLQQNELVFTLCNPNSFDRRKLVLTQYGECEILSTSYNLNEETMTINLKFNHA